MIFNVKFETSVFTTDKIIDTDKKQIVLVGKSNVGKSSFINALTNNSKLAKVGNTPGKTRCLNYYNVHDDFYIVDMPGYGYSKMSHGEKKSVEKLVDKYLSSGMVSYIFFLVDIRHKPTNHDRHMYEYLMETGIPFTIVANKLDKISKSKVQDNINDITKTLFAKEAIIPFSGEKKVGVDLVCDIINNVIDND